jgi:hypothetical protein
MSDMVSEVLSATMVGTTPVSDIIRGAHVVASELTLKRELPWIRQERDGYSADDVLPQYRITRGSPVFWNPFHGWCPVVGPTGVEDLFEKVPLRASVADLETDVSKGACFSVAKELDEYFHGLTKPGITTKFGVKVGGSGISRAIEGARSRIADWALSLKASGKTAEGTLFVQAPPATLAQNTLNVYGDVNQSQIAQSAGSIVQTTSGADMPSVRALIRDLETWSGAAKLPDQIAQEVHAELLTLRAQIANPKPKSGVIRESLKSIRSILENAMGSALPTLLPQVIAVISSIS